MYDQDLHVRLGANVVTMISSSDTDESVPDEISRIVEENELIVNEYEQELAEVNMKYNQLLEEHQQLKQAKDVEGVDIISMEGYLTILEENKTLKSENSKIKRNYANAITSMSTLMFEKSIF